MSSTRSWTQEAIRSTTRSMTKGGVRLPPLMITARIKLRLRLLVRDQGCDFRGCLGLDGVAMPGEPGRANGHSVFSTSPTRHVIADE